jgi:cyanophycin synthetase
MKILDLHILNGPNFWSVRKHQIIVLKLDIEELEELPTNKIPGFYERLQQNLPGLYNHYCSEGYPGGLFERVKIGTWIGHVMEHVALELQTQAGMNCGFGRTRMAAGRKGIYNVVFEFLIEEAGIFAAESAFKVTEALVYNKPSSAQEDIKKLKSIYAEFCMGPSTTAIVDAATMRDIPHIRIDRGSLIQLGYGIHQQHINTTITGKTANIAVDIAADKFLTKTILKNASVPVANGLVIDKDFQLNDAIVETGYPIVIKPLNSNHGKGVTTRITNFTEAYNAFKFARRFSEKVIVEKYYPGNDYRLLVIDYKLAAVALRTPAKVTGDGVSSVKALIEKTNRNPLRGNDHEKVLTKITIDENTMETLRHQDMTLESIPPEGKTVFVKQTANLSTGGTSEDVTDFVHPEIVQMAERAARSIGLDICGIDMVLNDICKPVNDNGVVLEINAAPGFRMHTHPSKGKPRLVGEKVVDMLFPPGSNGRIPITAITGTNGKTTTTRLLAHIAKLAGYHPGYTTTEGIYNGDELIEEGDCTGPLSASIVLRDKTVDFAVLECARGGMLRSGLAFDKCDVGIVTNVAEDHIGLKDIESIEQMAKVKAIVAESVKPNGYAVLNADNDYTYQMMTRLKCNIALFSTDPQSERIRQHTLNGGLAAILGNENIVLVKGKKKLLIESVENIPLTFQGKALFMIENVMAATLAAYIHNIPVSVISQGLRSFVPSAENSPGRLNIFDFSSFRLMIDYAHNYHGITALGAFILKTDAVNKIGIISTAGDRRDVDIFNVGKAAAGIFDRIIIRIDSDKRGRKETEISGLLLEGIRSVHPEVSVTIIPDELDAIDFAISVAAEGSLIVHFTEKVKASLAYAKKLQAEDSIRSEQDVYERISAKSHRREAFPQPYESMSD